VIINSISTTFLKKSSTHSQLFPTSSYDFSWTSPRKMELSFTFYFVVMYMGEVKCTLLQSFDMLKLVPLNCKQMKPTPFSSCKPLKPAPSLNCKLLVYWKLVVCTCFVEKERLQSFKTTLFTKFTRNHVCGCW
jgi:hypothetical protein